MPIPLPPIPEDNTSICLVIPNSPEWRQIYMGALVIMQQWWYWDVENSIDAEDVVQRVQQCAYLTGLDYEACMFTCEDLLECIQNDANVQSAISSLILQNTTSSDIEYAQNQGGLILGDGNNPTCDSDTLWGGISNIVDQANINNVDALEIVETYTNINELISELMGGGGSKAATIVNAIIDWVAWAQDNIAENYNAQITTTYLNEIKCDLFCIAKDNCEITPEILTDYFYDRLESELTFASLFNETLAFLVSGTWSGTEIADVMMLSQFAIRAQIGTFLGGIGFNTVDQDMRVGFTEPSNAWTILCDCGWVWNSDFPASENIWNVVVGGGGARATWALSTGYSSTDNPTGGSPARYMRGSQIITDTIVPTEITQVTLTYNLTKGSIWYEPTTAALGIIAYRNGGAQITEFRTFAELVDGDNQQVTLDLAFSDIVQIQTWIRSSLSNTATYSGVAKIVGVTVRGFGDNPFE